MECPEVRAKIYSMFAFNFTEKNVEETKKYLQPHLLVCAECRSYLKWMYEEKKEEFERVK